MSDIVSEMVQQMGLTPHMADQLQQQQSQSQNGGGMGGMRGLPSTAEEQMMLMEAAQNPQSMAPMDYLSETESVSSASTESEVDLNKAGLNTHPKGFMDKLMDYLKDPLVVMVLFIILGLTQATDLIKKLLPAIITNNNYYFLGVRSIIMGVLFLISKLVIS